MGESQYAAKKQGEKRGKVCRMIGAQPYSFQEAVKGERKKQRKARCNSLSEFSMSRSQAHLYATRAIVQA